MAQAMAAIATRAPVPMAIVEIPDRAQGASANPWGMQLEEGASPGLRWHENAGPEMSAVEGIV